MSSALEATFSGVEAAAPLAHRGLAASAPMPLAEPGRVDEAGADGVDADLRRERAGQAIVIVFSAPFEAA